MERGEYNVQGHLSLSPDVTHAPVPGLVDLTAGDDSASRSLESRVPHMQAVWDKTVGQELEIPYKYRTVAVLIVHWAEHLDRDLKCGEEIEGLKKLFTDHFNFQSSICTLHDKRDPQLQLRNAIDSLVLAYDGPCRTNLLIVYYTGHGIGRDEDGLDITGVREPGVSAIGPKYEPRANWNAAEESLKGAEADVLTILDCCCAGSIMKGSTEDIRTFEVLAATGRKMPTEPPGKRSFTCAMIDALLDQLRETDQAPFTTYALNQEIMRRRVNHRSHLFSRHPSSSHRFIKLAPLQRDPCAKVPTNVREASYLTVRFAFKDVTKLEPDQVKKLATGVSQVASNSDLGINRIEWVDFQVNRDGERLAEVLQLLQTVKDVQRRWRALSQANKRKRSRNEASEDDDQPDTKRPALQTPSRAKSSCPNINPLSPPRSVQSGRASPA